MPPDERPLARVAWQGLRRARCWCEYAGVGPGPPALPVHVFFCWTVDSMFFSSWSTSPRAFIVIRWVPSEASVARTTRPSIARSTLPRNWCTAAESYKGLSGFFAVAESNELVTFQFSCCVVKI